MRVKTHFLGSKKKQSQKQFVGHAFKAELDLWLAALCANCIHGQYRLEAWYWEVQLHLRSSHTSEGCACVGKQIVAKEEKWGEREKEAKKERKRKKEREKREREKKERKERKKQKRINELITFDKSKGRCELLFHIFCIGIEQSILFELRFWTLTSSSTCSSKWKASKVKWWLFAASDHQCFILFFVSFFIFYFFYFLAFLFLVIFSYFNFF